MSNLQQNNRWGRRLRLLTAIAVAAVVALGGMSVAAADDDVKIGYVDLYRALEESDEGQQIKSDLEKEFQRRQEQLDEKQQEVMEQQQELEQQAMMLSEERRQQKAMELQRDIEELQETYLTLQQELAQQEAEAVQELFERMQPMIEELGEERGFTLVIEKTDTSVLYSVDGLDLTDELIERFDAAQ